jgi:phosphate transport system protein
MREQATLQLQVAMDAFADLDATKASALFDMDEVMEDLQKDLFRAILSTNKIDEAALQRAVQMALVGRFYERTADHAVTIGERVTFMVTGQMPLADSMPASLE